MTLGITVMALGGILLMVGLFGLLENDRRAALGFLIGGSVLAVIGAAQVDASTETPCVEHRSHRAEMNIKS